MNDAVVPRPEARRLRIAVLNRIFKSTGGGAERYSIALVEQLAARHEIHVFAQHIEHHWPGVTYHRIGKALERPRWINQLWFAFATWRATRKGFDVVHSHEMTWHANVQTVHVLPVKYSLFHGLHGWRLALRWLKVVTSPRLLAYLVLEAARYAPAKNKWIVVASSTLRDKVQQVFPQIQRSLEVLTPGVHAVPGLVAPDVQQAARQKLGLPAARTCLLFVANDYQKKGLDCALNALAALPEDFVLAVVGNGAHIPLYTPIAEGLGVAQRTFFLGALADTDLAYEAADGLVHPTLEDTFAMVVLEAMAHGLPVILSDAQHCGIAELLTDGLNAMTLTDPRDARALANQIAIVFETPGKYSQLSQAGVQFAKDYAWSALAQRQEDIYFRTVALRQDDASAP